MLFLRQELPHTDRARPAHRQDRHASAAAADWCCKAHSVSVPAGHSDYENKTNEAVEMDTEGEMAQVADRLQAEAAAEQVPLKPDAETELVCALVLHRLLS